MFRKQELARTNDRSEQARIGEYVQVDIAPQVLYVKIVKGAPEHAIRILAARLYEHVQSAVTRLFLKKGARTGKFSYSLWLPAKTLQAISQPELFERIRKITNGMKKSVTIIVKQNIEKGSIQELWSKKHTLL
jgi:ABC-type phosphate transport system auxiliary subunit